MGQSDLEAAFDYYLRTLARDLWERVEREYRFHPSRRWRFDFAFPAERLAVEVDGGQWLPRGGRHARDSDREKLNAAAAMGWRVLRFSGQMIDRDPGACVEQLRTALEELPPAA